VVAPRSEAPATTVLFTVAIGVHRKKARVLVIAVAIAGGKTVAIQVHGVAQRILIVAVAVAGAKAVTICVEDLKLGIAVIAVTIAGRKAIPIEVIQVEPRVLVIAVLPDRRAIAIHVDAQNAARPIGIAAAIAGGGPLTGVYVPGGDDEQGAIGLTGQQI
jgi:hypothetical protein